MLVGLEGLRRLFRRSRVAEEDVNDLADRVARLGVSTIAEHSDTSNDAIIAAVLAEDEPFDHGVDSSTSDGDWETSSSSAEETATQEELWTSTDDVTESEAERDTMYEAWTSSSDEDPEADESFEWATAIAIVDSTEEESYPVSPSIAESPFSMPFTTQPEHEHTILPGPSRPMHQPTPASPACPICTEELSSALETGERTSAYAAPLRTYCPACTQVFHNACLAMWFRAEREGNPPPNCPMCRTEMEEEFVEEVKASEENL